jgi:lycopene cyclase domain-containing protein
MEWIYFIGLSVSLLCLSFIDYRFKLAFFHDARRTAITLAVAIGLFIIWDILGITLGIFYHGGSSFTLPVRLLPEFPIEELLFLTLLTYVTLLAYRWFERVQQ